MRNKLDRINIFEFIRLWNDESNDLDKSRIKVKFLNNDLIDMFQADVINLKGLTGEIVDVVDYSYDTGYVFVSIELDKHIESLKDWDNQIYFELSNSNLKDLQVRIYRDNKFTDLFGRS